MWQPRKAQRRRRIRDKRAICQHIWRSSSTPPRPSPNRWEHGANHTILAESTNQSYKTTKAALEKLEKMGFVAQTRKIGNAQAYRFLVENHLSGSLARGEEFQRNQTDI